MPDSDKEISTGGNGGEAASPDSRKSVLFNLSGNADIPGKRGKFNPAQNQQASGTSSSSAGGFSFDVGTRGRRERAASMDFDDIWERAFSEINSDDIESIYESRPETPELHSSRGPGQFATCCPNCSDVHYRADCLYDVTDLMLYYMRTESSCKRIFDTLMTLGVGGIDFTNKQLFDASLGNGRFKLYYSCKDAVIAMCETVMRMDAISDLPAKPQDGEDLKALFKKACDRRIFVHFPSIYYLTNPDVFSDMIGKAQQPAAGSDDPDEGADGNGSTDDQKIVDLDNIKAVLELLLSTPEKIICDLSIDSDMKVYDERKEGSTKPNMLILRCRKCGMPVALPAGKHDEFIIGMLGLTSAGKSSVIYAINYLVTEKCKDISFPYNSAHPNSFALSFSFNPYDSGSGPLREDRDRFAKGKSVTKTTKGERFHSTITVTLEKNGVVEKTINLVLIDIAGETSYGNDTQSIYFLADCFWFCILPSQNGIPDGTVRTDDIDSNAMYEFYKGIFDQINEGRGNKKVPIALIYTRSDCYPTDNNCICRSADDYSTDMDLLRNFIISDGLNAGVNAGAIRKYSMEIMEYAAKIRKGKDVGRYAVLSDISAVRAGEAGSEALGRCPVDGMTFFETKSRYCLFACSPYGRKPLDADKSMWEKEHEKAVKKLKEAEAKLDSLKTGLRDTKEAVEKAEEAVREAKRNLDSATDEASKDAARKVLADKERDLEIAKGNAKNKENEYNSAQQSYSSARDQEIQAQIEWNNAISKYQNSGQDTPPNPFGVILPVLWSLSQEGVLLSVMVNSSGQSIKVDADWLALNRHGVLPSQKKKNDSIPGRVLSELGKIFKKK